ncbi:hypothetical protein EZV62_017000 [Acer yangbiense]|uniref:Peptidase metallopeptidase domain-containing protein n=1 Tax=Acer yangbiense TaxID=1000413 RepID=A0A5C7HQ59_9ROSI|nr:hypothetical protein EZV62_017000 [Acer yangbiense]
MMTEMNCWSLLLRLTSSISMSTPLEFLDRKTLSKIAMPRCGNADIVNGTNYMKSGEKSHHHHHGSGSPYHTVAHFSFFPRRQRWPSSLTYLTYSFLPGTRGEAMEPVAKAFRTWQGNTHFTFSRVADSTNAYIKIGFGSRDHGDGFPFDRPGQTIAHAFAPTDGRFHYDADEQWAAGASVQPPVRILSTWKLLHCMKLVTFLDSDIAKCKELSCFLPSGLG